MFKFLSLSILVRWPESSAGVRGLLRGEALSFLDFFGLFLRQGKNEQSNICRDETQFRASVDLREEIFKHALNQDSKSMQ